MNDLQSLLHPQTLAVCAALVVVLQAIKNAIYEAENIANPPGWVTVLVVMALGFGIAFAESRLSPPVEGAATVLLSDLWWIQGMVATGFMILTYGGLKATFGKMVTPVAPPAPLSGGN